MDLKALEDKFQRNLQDWTDFLVTNVGEMQHRNAYNFLKNAPFPSLNTGSVIKNRITRTSTALQLGIQCYPHCQLSHPLSLPSFGSTVSKYASLDVHDWSGSTGRQSRNDYWWKCNFSLEFWAFMCSGKAGKVMANRTKTEVELLQRGHHTAIIGMAFKCFIKKPSIRPQPCRNQVSHPLMLNFISHEWSKTKPLPYSHRSWVSKFL